MSSFITPIAHQIVVLYRKTLSEHTATALILVKPARLADTPEELRRQYHHWYDQHASLTHRKISGASIIYADCQSRLQTYKTMR